MCNSDNANQTDRNNNIAPNSQPLYLTRDQEHWIMVSALLQVISGSRVHASSSSNHNACDDHPPLDAGPCPLCNITGCYGCAFPRHKEIIKEDKKKHKGVRKRPSGKWSAEIWDPSRKERRWLGTFPTSEMAAHEYNKAVAEIVERRSERLDTKNRARTIHQEDDRGK